MIQREGEESLNPLRPKELAKSAPVAAQALAEAEQRRSQSEGSRLSEVEVEGRGGLEPTRYGDWEVKGLASDF